VPATVVKTRRSGWYYRVIEEGAVVAGDKLDLVERRLPDWSVERVFGLPIGGAGKREPAALRDLAAMEQLATTWRARAEKLGAL
jgi:MOSC domain-containing protein YiiM